MSSSTTTSVWLALLVLGAPGCIEVIKVQSDAGFQEAGSADSAAADAQAGDGGTTDGNVSADGGDGIVTGSPQGEWRNVTNNLANQPAQCGTVTTIVASPYENRVLVGIAGSGVHASTDGGETWSRLGTGAGSVSINARVSQFVFDPDHDGTYYVSGIYAEPGLVRTTDNGSTFKALGSVWHNDSVSIDFSDPARKTLLAGTHEATGTLWRSTDGGANWKNIGNLLPADAGWSLFPLVIDAQTFLLGTPGTGVYLSHDAGMAWSKVSELGGGAAPLWASDDSIYWADAEGLVRSTDKGETWEQVTPAGILYAVTPVELPDGRIAMRGPRGVLVSGDLGAHWELVAPPQPFDDPMRNFALAYSTDERAFFVAQSGCAASVPDNAVARFDWDWE